MTIERGTFNTIVAFEGFIRNYPRWRTGGSFLFFTGIINDYLNYNCEYRKQSIDIYVFKNMHS